MLSSKTFSQVGFNEYHFYDNKTNIPDSIKNILSDKSILLFVPINLEDSLAYKKKVVELQKRLVFLAVENTNLYCFYFHQDLKNNSNGLQLHSRMGSNLIAINQLECFVVNFDTVLLFRASTLSKKNFNLGLALKGENVYKINIVDANKCFPIMPERIPAYYDFIKEALKPNYSVDERIDKVLDSVAVTKAILAESQQAYNTRIEAKLDSILTILNSRLPAEKTQKPLTPTKKK